MEAQVLGRGGVTKLGFMSSLKGEFTQNFSHFFFFSPTVSMASLACLFKFSGVSQRIPLSSNTVDASGGRVLKREARAVTSKCVEDLAARCVSKLRP